MTIFSIIRVPVNVSIKIYRIEEIEEVKMSFSLKFKLVLEWFDDQITWNNLKDDKYLNIPEKNILSNIWLPVVIFVNAENQFETYLDRKTRVVVEKKGDFTLSPITDMEEHAYYKGSENSLQYSRDFYLRFSCQFDLRNYPFDTQICSVLISKPSKEDKFMKFMAKSLIYSGPKGLAEYFITSLEISEEDVHEEYDLKVDIQLKRRIAKHLQSTYLPSLCLLIIAQVSTMSNSMGKGRKEIFFHRQDFKSIR